ncbi:MAG: hypothetical protein WDN45_06365 [Caulobacteraceae bacterium]
MPTLTRMFLAAALAATAFGASAAIPPQGQHLGLRTAEDAPALSLRRDGRRRRRRGQGAGGRQGPPQAPADRPGG